MDFPPLPMYRPETFPKKKESTTLMQNAYCRRIEGLSATDAAQRPEHLAAAKWKGAYVAPLPKPGVAQTTQHLTKFIIHLKGKSCSC